MNATEKWDVAIRMVTLLGGICAGVFAYFKYSDTKEKEFYTYYWNTKAELYRELSEVASTLATTPSEEEFQESRERYWALAFGPITLVESEGLEKQITNFGNLVDQHSSDNLPAFQLEAHANDLSGALKDDLMASWRQPFSEFQYSSKSEDVLDGRIRGGSSKRETGPVEATP